LSFNSEARSPDLFEPFEYTPDMEPDFQRIDSEASDGMGGEEEDIPPSTLARVLVPESPPTTFSCNQETWVVFLGRVPGIYDSLYFPSALC
jgi:hypothetical protein